MGAHRGQRHVGRCRLHNDSHGKTIYPQPYVQVDDDEPTGPKKKEAPQPEGWGDVRRTWRGSGRPPSPNDRPLPRRLTPPRVGTWGSDPHAPVCPRARSSTWTAPAWGTYGGTRTPITASHLTRPTQRAAPIGDRRVSGPRPPPAGGRTHTDDRATPLKGIGVGKDYIPPSHLRRGSDAATPSGSMYSTPSHVRTSRRTDGAR